MNDLHYKRLDTLTFKDAVSTFSQELKIDLDKSQAKQKN